MLYTTFYVLIFIFSIYICAMQLSVVILNYNVRYFLETCVLSVQKAIQHLDAEIIVVDNASSDGSCKMMHAQFPEIQFIENTENVGFPKGNNIGVEKASGDYICILNPDTVVAEDTFTKLLSFAESQKNAGITGCKLIDGGGTFLPESKRGIPTPWIAFTKVIGLYKLFPRSTWFNQYYAQHVSEQQTSKVAILVGAFMFMKRELYIEIGGFDENCFMYSDDIDLSYLALQKGKDNYYFADTSVIHYKGESTNKDVVFMKRFQEAMTFFYTKHFKTSFFFSVMMQIGIQLFALKKLVQHKRTHKTIPERYIIFSDNIELGVKISKQLTKKCDVIHVIQDVTKELKKAPNTPTEILFDLNCISYKSMIALMEELRIYACTFKILSPETDFMIGSNHSDDKGEVIILS